MKELLDLLTLGPEDQLGALAHRRDLVVRLWAHEEAFGRVLTAAVPLAAEGSESTHLTIPARGLLDATIGLLIARPSDVVHVCAALPDDDLRQAFLEAFMWHPLASPDVIFALVSDPRFLERLPGGGWLGHAVHRRGAALLNAYPGRKFKTCIGVGFFSPASGKWSMSPSCGRPRM